MTEAVVLKLWLASDSPGGHTLLKPNPRFCDTAGLEEGLGVCLSRWFQEIWTLMILASESHLEKTGLRHYYKMV